MLRFLDPLTESYLQSHEEAEVRANEERAGCVAAEARTQEESTARGRAEARAETAEARAAELEAELHRLRGVHSGVRATTARASACSRQAHMQESTRNPCIPSDFLKLHSPFKLDVKALICRSRTWVSAGNPASQRISHHPPARCRYSFTPDWRHGTVEDAGPASRVQRLLRPERLARFL